MMYTEPLTSLVVFDGVMYDCTASVKKEVAMMVGQARQYEKKKREDIVYSINMNILSYLDRALENGTAAYAGLAIGKEAA